MRKVLFSLAVLFAGFAHAQVKVNQLPPGTVSGSYVTICDNLVTTSSCTFTQLASWLATNFPAGATFYSPNLITPALGVATATSINGTTIPSSSALAGITGTPTTGHCAEWSSSGILEDSGGACGGGTGGGGTVNNGTAGQLGYYASNGNIISGLGTTGAGNAVLAIAPTLNTPTLVAATATSINGTPIPASSTLPTVSGSTVSTHCAEWLSSGVLEDSGAGCGSGGSTTIPAYTTFVNPTASTAAPQGVQTQFYYVAPSVTQASINAAEAQACTNGGGIVVIPPGIYTGVLTTGLPYCSTASVGYDSFGFGLYGVASGAGEYGAHFIDPTGTYTGFSFNAVDCGGGACIEPTNGSTFIAGMLGGVSIHNITFDGFAYGIKCGALYQPGCVNIDLKNVNIINSTQWGLWMENFWKQSKFEKVYLSGNAAGQGAFCSSGGSANQNGNSTIYGITAMSANAETSRGILVCGRGIGGSLNNFGIHDVLSYQEGNSTQTQSVTWLGPTAATTVANNTAILLANASTYLTTGDQVVFSTTVGNLTAGTVYYATNVFSSNFAVASTYANAVAGTAITVTASGSTTVTSQTLNVTDASKFAADQPVTFTGTLTNTPFTAGVPYFVNSSQINGTANLITVSLHIGDQTPLLPTGSVSGLSVTTYGFSPLEVVGYDTPGGHGSVLASSIDRVDLEASSVIPAAITAQLVYDTDFTAGGYITNGSIGGVVIGKLLQGDVLPSISGNANGQTFFLAKDYGNSIVKGVRSQPGALNASSFTGIGLDLINSSTAFAANWPRCTQTGGALYIAGVVSYDACYNGTEPFISWDNFPLGAKTTQISLSTTTILPGATTSNVAYTGSGAATWTLPLVSANGDGAVRWFDNLSSSTLTLTTQTPSGGSQQLFNGASTSLVIPANSGALVWSQTNGSVLGYGAVTPGSGGGSGTVATGTVGNLAAYTGTTTVGSISTPAQCSGSQFATGITATGAANCATPAGGGNVSTSGSPAQYQTTVFSNGTAITGVAPSATAGEAYVSNGASSYPSFSTSLPGVTSVNGTTIPASSTLLTSGGALGTPSSGTLTNATGLPLATGVTGTLAAAQEPAHTGDATNTAGSLALTVKGINGTLLSSLGTGILKNTTGTGVPSIATSADIIADFSGTCSTSTFLRGDGSCQTPSGSGNVSNTGTPTSGQIAQWTSATVVQGLATTGSGNAVLATSPTLVTPTLGAATATSINGTTIPASSTLLTSASTINATQVNGAAVPTSAVVLASNGSGQIIAATSTGTGSNVLATSPTLVTPNIGAATASGLTLSGVTGSTQCLQASTSGVVSGTGSACGSGGSTSFSGLTTGTNTTATMTVGTGGSIAISGSGTNQATSLTTYGGLPGIPTQSVLGNGSGSSGAPTALTLSGNLVATASGLGTSQAINAQTGTSYAIQTSDAGKLLTFNNASAVAVSLSQATTTGFTAGFSFDVHNYGAGSVTITPTTSTVGGGSTLVIAQNRDCTITSDSANYQVSACTALVSGSGGVSSVAMTVPSFLSVSGSPITTSGTLAVSLSGTALPIANGGTGATTLAGASIPVYSGAITSGHCAEWLSATVLEDSGAGCGSGGSTAFSALTGSTNTSAAMLVGTGASLGPTGSGTVSANQINGAAVPTSAGMVSTTSGGAIQAQAIVSATGATGPTYDYAPSGFGTTTGVLYITPASGGSTYGGLVAQSNLQQVYIVNAEAAGGADNILLLNQSSSDTTAANRFLTAATTSLAIPPGGRVLCLYLGGSVARWQCQ